MEITIYRYEKKLKIFADSREKGSIILKELVNQGMSVETKNLITDYIISERVGIERKDMKDFINSIINKRLLSQIKSLKENFSKPILILEGEEDIYSIKVYTLREIFKLMEILF